MQTYPVRELSARSKLPVFNVYGAFRSWIWQGNARDEADAKRRAYAATTIAAVSATRKDAEGALETALRRAQKTSR